MCPGYSFEASFTHEDLIQTFLDVVSHMLFQKINYLDPVK